MYYLSSHFLAVSSWLIAKESYKKINKKHRIDFWIGIGIGTWSTAILMTVIGYLSADYLNKDMLIGLAIVNPVYFFCMMIGAMKNLSISIAVIGGTVLGPAIYLFSTEWALLFLSKTLEWQKHFLLKFGFLKKMAFMPLKPKILKWLLVHLRLI